MMRLIKKNQAFIILTVCVLAALTALIFLLIPTVNLEGEQNMTVPAGGEFSDPGATASFFFFDCTGDIEKQGSVDTAVPGEYQLTYTVHKLFLTGSAVRTVTVVDETPPTVELTGPETVFLPIGGQYEEPGFTASDNIDGDLSGAVAVQGTVDTAVAGDYTLTYTVKDAAGNEATAKRLVSVSDRSPYDMSLTEFTLNGYFDDVILQPTEDQGQAYVDGTIFFGDSIVDNFIFFGSVPRRCVWAKTSLQPAVALDWDINIYTDGTQRKITDALAAFKPERIYINLGANAVNQFTVDYFIEKYEEVLTAMQQASPTTKIIVGSVYPFDARYDNPKVPKPPFGNDKINKMNVRLCELCRKLGIKFLNVAEVMKDENGQAIPGILYKSDGIHPGEEGTKLIIQYFRTHAWL